MLSSTVQPSRMVINQDLVKYHPFYGTYTEYQKNYNVFQQDPYNPANASTSSTYLKDLGNVQNNYRYAAGWTAGEPYYTLMSDQSLAFMSKMITGYLQGVHPEGKNIIVPESTIRSVADAIYSNGASNTQTEQQMVIRLIVDKIREEFDQIETNNTLSAWVQNYDGTNGLKQFNNIKLNNKGMNWNTNMMWKY